MYDQQAANKRWRESSPDAKEKSNKAKMFSTARSFIRNRATLEDLAELEQLIAEKKKTFPN